MTLSNESIEELRSFIVESNLENALLSQLNSVKSEIELKKWLGV